MAILIHKSLQFSTLAIPNLKTIEAVTVTALIKINKKNELIEIILVYIPNGNNYIEEEFNIGSHSAQRA